MADTVEIPEWDYVYETHREAGKPCWSKVYREDNGQRIPLKPHIRCMCGNWSGIGLHHVHSDGTVTDSFFDATKEQIAAMGDAGKRFAGHDGCGWHVHLKLLGYDQGEFLPEK